MYIYIYAYVYKYVHIFDIILYIYIYIYIFIFIGFASYCRPQRSKSLAEGSVLIDRLGGNSGVEQDINIKGKKDV